MFICKYHVSNSITYLGIFSSVLGIFLAINGYIALAMISMMISGICDLFDGVFARRFERSEAEKQFGIEIDSLADVFSFGALPIVILASYGLTGYLHALLYIFYALALVTRLAFFNTTVQGLEGPISHYTGLPVTYSAVFIPSVWIMSYFISKSIFDILISVVLFILGLMFILKIKIRKPRGLAYLFFLIYCIGSITAIAILM